MEHALNASTASRLQALLDRTVDGKRIFGTTFSLRIGDAEWSGTSGNFAPGDPFFIASTTKLFVTALMFRFEEEGLLELSDPIARHFPEDLLRGLQTRRGRDNVPAITLRHLLAHTSGIPDYFQGRNARGESLEKEIVAGVDQAWTLEDAVARSKTLAPPFDPGAPRRALYSDTNYQLLGRVLEQVSGRSFAELVAARIAAPLGLARTYVYGDAEDTGPKTLRYRARELHIPRAMISFGPDGGIVSTSEDLARFAEAFFGGELFPKRALETAKTWNPIFFPLQSGVGLHRFRLQRLFDPFRKLPELIGHSGLSGALAFHAPEHDLYVAGTVNQVDGPGTSFRLMIRLVQEALRARR